MWGTVPDSISGLPAAGEEAGRTADCQASVDRPGTCRWRMPDGAWEVAGTLALAVQQVHTFENTLLHS